MRQSHLNVIQCTATQVRPKFFSVRCSTRAFAASRLASASASSFDTALLGFPRSMRFRLAGFPAAAPTPRAAPIAPLCGML